MLKCLLPLDNSKIKLNNRYMKVTGLFAAFDNLESISAEDLMRWLKPPHNLIVIQNLLANRILYPQVVPITKDELDFDLSLLKEALRSEKVKFLKADKNFLDKVGKKILIPEDFLQVIPDISRLVLTFIDGLFLEKTLQENSRIWTVLTSGENAHVLGTVVFPHFEGNGQMQFQLDGKNFLAKQGKLMVIPCPRGHCHLTFRFTSGEILGLKEGMIEVYGGQLGLIVDGRGM